MNIKTSIAIGLLILLLCSNCTNVNKTNQPEATAILAERPPMGWNSWICFGTSVTENEVKANADFMAENLKNTVGNTLLSMPVGMRPAWRLWSNMNRQRHIKSSTNSDASSSIRKNSHLQKQRRVETSRRLSA